VERSLSLQLLLAALDGRTGIPSAADLQRLMADVEVQLFLRRAEVPQELLDAAWYLHAVASVNEARQRYTVARQRQAFLVSAHIFDLALNQDGRSRFDRLSFGFAAAIGYRRGGRDPNATAIMNRLRADIDTESPLLDHIDTLPIEAGLAFLGFETRTVFNWLGSWRRQLAALARASELPDLTSTTFGTTHMVVLGAEDLLMYFARGDTVRLERGQTRLRAAAIGQAGPGALDARWVAAHLLGLSGEAGAGSLWSPTVLPPSVPPLVRQAFTMGSPPVLTLWEPQRELLTGDQSPFDPHVRRMVLAVPTSGGKTLLAQMLAVEHLATAEQGVCYVAPTRSLGREVRRAMANRVQILQKETGSDQPDFPMFADLTATMDDTAADVEVMTPERLAHLLRHDAQAVLERFGMFIFDEAQLLKERGRGFTLESTIALLDYLTWDRPHRIVLISAAMGNAGAIAQWLSPNGDALQHESQWRGPRRLHAAFTTQAHWEDTRVEPVAGRVWPYRLITDLSGQIRLRLAEGRTARLSTQGDTGWRLVRKSKATSTRQTGLQVDSATSTKQYVIASEMITALGHAGSVLVVAGTRTQAQLLARGLAQTLDEDPATTPLVDFVRLQLGDEHPLVAVLRHGVGFHHAGLPIEVLEALEDAVRDDTLPYLTCTSTLTDGVNLPVRTVVIYDQSYQGQPDDTRLRGARLVNAMGRAGRAGKETEGWIVLVRGATPTEADFRVLNPDAEALAVTSSLITAEALEAFAALEDEMREDADALFRTSDPAVTDFISFVWLVLAIEEEAGASPERLDVEPIVDATLAAVQSRRTRAACLTAARAVHGTYRATNPAARRRWPRTGTSIGSARTIDRLAGRLASTLLRRELDGSLGNIRDPLYAIKGLRRSIAALLDLPEAPPWRFRISAQGADIPVEPVDLLSGWLEGTPLSELAQAHLAAATKADWRIEQMVDAVTAHFEHYLAWTLGALVELVNSRLEAADSDARLCPELGGYIRYGVSQLSSLILMTAGIRSRRLAHAIETDLPHDIEPRRENLRSWLAGMGIAEWRTRYHASASEVLDLLDFTRLRQRSLLKTLLEAGQVDLVLPVSTFDIPIWDGPYTLEPMRDQSASPAPLAVYAGDELVSTIASQDHNDLSSILATGLDISVQIDDRTDPPRLSIALSPGEESAA
jgi:hypothetical protein